MIFVINLMRISRSFVSFDFVLVVLDLFEKVVAGSVGKNGTTLCVRNQQELCLLHHYWGVSIRVT